MRSFAALRMTEVGSAYRETVERRGILPEEAVSISLRTVREHTVERADERVVFRQDVDPVEEDRLDRVLPAPDRQRIVAERTEVRVQNKGRTIPRRH